MGFGGGGARSRGALDRSRRENRGHRQTRGPLRPAALPLADRATRAWMPGPERAAAARTRAVARAPSCSPVDRGHRLGAGGSEGEAVRRGGDGGEEDDDPNPAVGLGWAWMLWGFGYIYWKKDRQNSLFISKGLWIQFSTVPNFDMA